MENITVETFWRYPKPILRKEESVSEDVEAPRKKVQKNVPNFMKPLERKQDQVVVKKEQQKHE